MVQCACNKKTKIHLCIACFSSLIKTLSFLDIFYTSYNKAPYKSNTTLSAEEIAKLLDPAHNRGDWLLHQHFNKTLWKKISEYADFDEEVRRCNPSICLQG